jgi:hemerythrin-like domain-containing protein
MAEMSMNKVIHGAIRRDLGRFRRALDAFKDGDRARVAALHRAWANFDAQLTEHHEGEHDVAWPALEAIGVPGPVITVFDQEHAAMAADLATAGAAMNALAASASKAAAQAAGAAMAELETTTTTHLDHEEQQVEALLVEKTEAKDPAIKTMAKGFSRRASPPVAGTFFAWVQDGQSAEEKAGLRDSVPRPVIVIITFLFGRRYRKEIAPAWAGSGSF